LNRFAAQKRKSKAYDNQDGQQLGQDVFKGLPGLFQCRLRFNPVGEK
jgi:hypothetical protein